MGESFVFEWWVKCCISWIGIVVGWLKNFGVGFEVFGCDKGRFGKSWMLLLWCCCWLVIVGSWS